MGSPAHAGIDRGGLGVGARNDGFPRPRGDRPTPYATLLLISTVPPPTRG